LGKLHKEFTEIVLDATTDSNRRDIVAEALDAGIRLGEFIEKDMIAVRVSPDHRAAIVGAPDYFSAHSKPKEPRDLLQHSCINLPSRTSRGVPMGVRKGQEGTLLCREWPFDR
jgi:DNA-binding transcriptional LysR family regulator